ncbi:hypothetical protein QYE76_067060 [Lolium multiflorum]|uniref:60S ribosomal export protein NMD3 n=1 Tax=Lolium multiflorum TaxID=4521 RepID=A0AAD8SC29_LOLMU|nr:hypothetical protein QYE76_067060 [Lolium multiflorum]
MVVFVFVVGNMVMLVNDVTGDVMVVFVFVVIDVVMLVTSVAMMVSGFVIADVTKLVNGGAMMVSSYVLMLVMDKLLFLHTRMETESSSLIAVAAWERGDGLCCMCGVSMQPNPGNMCARCLRARVDITEGVPRNTVIVYCPDCFSYLQPPCSWVKAGPESPELKHPLTRLRVSLSSAEFVFSEPHSKCLRLRREDLNGIVLEQTHPVEFVHVPHRRTFLYLEQLLIKHGQATLAIRVAFAPGGLDFFFGSRSHAARLVDFLGTVAPIQTNTTKQLVSHDTRRFIYNYKRPVISVDLALLSSVTNAIAVLDALTLRVHHLEEKKYRVYNFRAELRPLISNCGCLARTAANSIWNAALVPRTPGPRGESFPVAPCSSLDGDFSRCFVAAPWRPPRLLALGGGIGGLPDSPYSAAASSPAAPI